MYMTKNVLRNLFTKSATRLYPFVKREIFDEVRGALGIEIEKCILCKACELRCPTRCIKVDPKEGVWSFDPMACVACGVCVSVCPKKCLFFDKEYRKPLLARGIISHQGTPRVKKAPSAELAGDGAASAASAENSETPA